MTAGRTPLPSNVHRLRGNPSKLSEGELEGRVRVPVEAPSCPAQLGRAARYEWYRIRRHLIAAGLVSQLDRGALVGYCQAWGEWVLLEGRIKNLIAAHGADALIDVTPSGYKQIAAIAQARDRALDRMLRFAKEFGLTPSSRVQATAGQQLGLPGVPDDPMEDFLRAGESMSRAG